MAAMGTDQQAVAPAELPGGWFVGKAQAGAALKQGDPLHLLLVVPEPLGAGRLAGVDPLQPPVSLGRQHAAGLAAGRRAGPRQQVVRLG